MKKFLITILAILYLATSTGAAFYTHYCMGKVYSFDVVKSGGDGCSKCGMEANDGCCKDELKVFKIKDNNQLISSGITIAPSFAVVSNFYKIVQPVIPYVAGSLVTNNNSPPNSPGTSLCILNCVFRL